MEHVPKKKGGIKYMYIFYPCEGRISKHPTIRIERNKIIGRNESHKRKIFEIQLISKFSASYGFAMPVCEHPKARVPEF